MGLSRKKKALTSYNENANEYKATEKLLRNATPFSLRAMGFSPVDPKIRKGYCVKDEALKLEPIQVQAADYSKRLARKNASFV